METLKLIPEPHHILETEINAEQAQQLRGVVEDYSFERVREIPGMPDGAQVPDEWEWYRIDQKHHIIIEYDDDSDRFSVAYSRACAPYIAEVPGIDAPNSDEIPFRFASEDEQGIPDVEWK